MKVKKVTILPHLTVVKIIRVGIGTHRSGTKRPRDVSYKKPKIPKNFVQGRIGRRLLLHYKTATTVISSIAIDN